MKVPEKVRKLSYYSDPQSCGTMQYHKLNSFAPIVGTDGVAIAFEKLECFWIGDIIASIIPKLRKREETFFFVNVVAEKHLDPDTESNEGIFYLHDGDYNIVYKQEIPFTDLSEPVHLYVSMEDLVIVLLPSEY